ncbi:MAG TPA: carboxypeptidase regulatory-like domain-containing protein, partial [Fibrobacteria bacterium]|nr:carboxypeptidase regulatory-like domain-containing protein [Fibrobacteria bacterium]
TVATVRDLSLLPAVFRLSGRLVDHAGQPLSGLPIELRHPLALMRATTGADGVYAFSGVPAGGEYRLAVKPPTAEYDPKDSSFALGLDAPSQVTLDLATVSRLASLSGTVLLDGTPVEGAALRLMGGPNNVSALSQPGGAFRIPGVAGSSQTLTLRVSLAGAGTIDTSLVIGAAEARSGLMLRLRALKVALSGTATSSEGKPLAGARLLLSGGARPDTLTAGQDGAFLREGLAANQSLSLTTLLDKARYDNVEVPLFLKEKDTTVAVRATVHAASVAVEVKDQVGAAVDGAEVTLDGRILGTTKDGRLSATGLARGEYRFAAGKASYRGAPEVRLALPGDTSVSLSLTLVKVVGGLYGTVSDTGLDRSNGVSVPHKLPGAVVRAISGTDTLADTADALGRYSLDGLQAGTRYAVTLVLPGYFPVRDSLTGAAEAQARDLTPRAIPGSILGRVTPGRSGMVVRLGHSAGGRLFRTMTVAGGYYAFLGLQNRGDYQVQAAVGDSASAAAVFQANGSTAKRLDLALDRLGALTGTVSGSGAGALPGARVEARHGLTGISAWTLTDASGNYSLAGLAPGDYAVTAERPGFRGASLSAAVAKGATTGGKNLDLEAADAGIAGLVADKDGNPVAADLVLALGGDTLRLRSNGAGQFLFAGLSQGTAALSAAEPGYAPAQANVAYGGKGLARSSLALTRSGSRLIGVLRDAMTNTALPGGTVRLSGTGASAAADSLGRFVLDLPSGIASPILVDASRDGYISRAAMPVWLDGDGSAVMDLALSADYRLDGQINVTVKEGKEQLSGLILSLQPFHPDDEARLGVSGTVPFSFRDLRRPAPYSLKVKREGYKDISRVVELTSASLDVALAYPTSRVRIFVTTDGKSGRGVEAALDGVRLEEHPDSAGLYLGAARMNPGRYELSLRDLDTSLIPLSSHFIALGEDSVRTDTVFASFRGPAIPDSTVGSSFQVGILRLDSLRPAPGVIATLFYRPTGAALWDSLPLDSAVGGFFAKLPAQERAGDYEYYYSVLSPSGIRIGTETPGGFSTGTAPARYSTAASPAVFRLRDPFLLRSIALVPQRLEADTSLYALGARDLFQVQARGEGGRSLDAHFDAQVAAGRTGYAAE